MSAPGFDADRTSDTNVYIAKAAVLEAMWICTADKFSPKGLFLVCPWIHELLDLGLPHGYRDVEADFESTSHLSMTPAESVFHENLAESILPRTPDNDHRQPDHLNVHYEDSGPSTPSSLLPPSPSAPFDEHTKALRFVARLRQPMTSLLLSARRDGMYKRVATDHDIVIQLRRGVSLDSMIVKVVQII